MKDPTTANSNAHHLWKQTALEATGVTAQGGITCVKLGCFNGVASALHCALRYHAMLYVVSDTEIDGYGLFLSEQSN